MANIEVKITKTNGDDYAISNKKVLDLDSTSQITNQPSEISYGVLANTGNIELFDYDNDIANKIANGELNIYNAPVKVFANNKQIQHHNIIDSEYIEANKNLSLSLGNSLSNWDNIIYNGVYVSKNKTALQLLKYILNYMGYNDTEITNMFSETIVYGNTTGTVSTYLDLINISYPSITNGTSCRIIIDELCTLAQLNVVEKDNGDIKFVSARPKKLPSSNIINIPRATQFSNVTKNIILRNKYDNVEYSKYSVTPQKLTLNQRTGFSIVFNGYVVNVPPTIIDISPDTDFDYSIINSAGEINNYRIKVNIETSISGTTTILSATTDNENIYLLLKASNDTYFLATLQPFIENISVENMNGLTVNTYKDMSYGNNIFVMVGVTKIAYSSDGTYWEETNISYRVDKILFGNNVFVAIPFGSYYYTLVSRNGIDWTYNATSHNYFYNIYFDTTLNLFIGLFESRLYYSQNGTIWEEKVSPISLQSAVPANEHSIAFGKGKLVVLLDGDDFGNFAYSTNMGDSWIKVSSQLYNDQLDYIEGLFVSSRTAGTENPLFISSDGIEFNNFKISSSANTIRHNNNTNILSYPNTPFLTDGSMFNEEPLETMICENIISDYSNGILTAKLSVPCVDYKYLDGTTAKTWDNGDTIQIGDNVKISGDSTYYRVTGRNFRYGGIAMEDLELQQVGVSPQVTITKALTNLLLDNPSVKVDLYDSYDAKVMAEEGYKLSTISVTMGGTDITNQVVNGRFIHIESVTGTIVITAVGVTYGHQISYSLTGVSSSNTNTIVAENSQYTTELISDYYFIPTITMGGNTITPTISVNGYSVDIPIVSGDVAISATATSFYTIKLIRQYTDGRSPTVSQLATKESGDSYRYTVIYAYDNLQVFMGGVDVTEETVVSRNRVDIDNVTGAVQIIITNPR